MVMERLLAIFNDASATDELEKCLWNFPLRGEVSLISFIEAVGLNCSVSRRAKEWVIFEIVFHHWNKRTGRVLGKHASVLNFLCNFTVC